ncbi:hypothetical protein [Sphingomonas sp. MMS24-J13]|uniref:hypothetical protein n=1 Tax=Sphingomonas sp. MMS24-J13 TaxID=3238686 RepID=UPI00384E16DA
MSRTAIAIFGLASVAGINAFGPAVAQRISHAVGIHRFDPAGGEARAATQLALATDNTRSGARENRGGDKAEGVR